MLDEHVLTPKAAPSPTRPTARAVDRSGDEEGQFPEPTLDAMQRQFSNVANEVGELAKLVRGGAKQALHTAADRAGDLGQDTADRARDVEHEVVEWIKERPIQASLLSMGLGALLWSMLKRS